MSGSPEPRRGHYESPRKIGPERRTMFKRLEKGVFHRLKDMEKGTSAYSNDSKRRSYHNSSKDTESYYQSSRSRETEVASEKRHNKKASSRRTEALSESEGSAGGHWKSKPKRQKSSDEDDLSQPWKKCIKDPVEIHNIKQRDRESMEEFVRRYKLEWRDVKGAPECMKISGFMHGITNPKLIKRLHDKILKSVDEMIRVTTSFLRGEVAASNRERKKSFPSWKQQEAGAEAKLQKGRLSELTKARTKARQIHSPHKNTKRDHVFRQRKVQASFANDNPSKKETLANSANFMGKIKVKLWKRLGEGGKRGKTSGKDKPLAMLMVQPWQRVARQKVTQTFSPESVISFPHLGEEDGTEGPMIIETDMGGHCMHRMEARGKENPSSSIYGPQNAKIPSDRRNSHATEQQDYSTRMHNGFRARGAAAQEWRKELCGLLRRNLDTFSWKPADITGVPRHIAEHMLNIHEGCLPVRQKKRGKTPERNKAICEEVEKLLEDVCRFQGLKQSMPQRWLSATGNRLEVIKSRMEKEVTRDIEETFKTLREINMKLNPKKYAFGMREGTFLGYKVDAGRLRVGPDKVEAVLNLPSPKCLKDVQKLNGKLASLNIFLSKSTEKYLPFFKTLKKCTKKSDFQWTVKEEMTFKQMKKLIAEPMLTVPKEKEELIMYLVAAKEAISAVLLTERDGKQMPIYFVSRALQGLVFVKLYIL
nr:reverse transcriptase domain-containing protein [Tanacetum cinerariifolium]